MLLKWKYYILLFGLLVFLAETISISYIATGGTSVDTCKMHTALKEKDGCEKHNTKKPVNCVDCPLCCLTLPGSFFAKPLPLIQFKKNNYSVFKNSLLSSYHDKTWKPPDVLYFRIS
jgi:hypothetical protein